MERLDKTVIGERIKALRKSKGLRQWQMADLLGATQPVVHKYENGILPEVKRLLTLAQIGNTTIEWILTGRHSENGSKEMSRLSPEIYDLAHQLRSLSSDDRTILAEALEIINRAVQGVRESARREAPEMSDAELGRTFKALEKQAREPLQVALAVYDAVMTSLSNSKVRELHRFTQPAEATKEGPVSIPSLQKSAG